MNIDWAPFPLLENNAQAHAWLLLQTKLGLAYKYYCRLRKGLE